MKRFQSIIVVAMFLCLSSMMVYSLESTRTLKKEIPASGAFAIENLAGSMKVLPGDVSVVQVTATVHAENAEVAGKISLEQVRNDKGVSTLRVHYPIEEYRSIRYPSSRREEETGGFLADLFGGNNSEIEYDHHKVRVSSTKGVLLYVDVEVSVPRRSVEGAFYNHVGKLTGEGIEGTLLFDTASADVTVSKIRGDVTVDVGSGDVDAASIEGNLHIDTGSGDCQVDNFNGQTASLDTGSGDIKIHSATGRRIAADTGSGDVIVQQADVEEFKADTGSGDVEFTSSGNRLRTISADTGSGDVTLHLGPDATFEAMADQGSGDLTSRYQDAQPIIEDREVVGYRRGDSKIHIDVETGSGDCVITP